MFNNDMIDASERAAADKAPLGTVKYVPSVGVNWLGGSLGTTGTDPYGARYFVQSVINDLTDKLGQDALFNGGLRIYTTLDPQRQKDAYNAVTSVLNFPDHPAGALVAIDNQGQVVAMMGGTDFASDKFNLATGEGGARGRQIGSTFKAFALADLVKRGLLDHLVGTRAVLDDVQEGRLPGAQRGLDRAQRLLRERGGVGGRRHRAVDQLVLRQDHVGAGPQERRRDGA